MLEPALLEQRLLLKESVIGGAPTLSKISAKIGALMTSETCTIEGCSLLTIYSIILSRAHELTYQYVFANFLTQLPINTYSLTLESDSMIKDLMYYKLDMSKVRYMLQACNDEIAQYNSLDADINTQISSMEETIKHLEIELKHEHLIREHRIQCENKSIEVNKYLNTASLDSKINELNVTLQYDNDLGVQLDSKIHKRSEQFDSLMHSISILQAKLSGDDDMVVAVDSAPVELEDDDARDGRDDNDGDGRDRAVASSTVKEINENDEDNHE